MHKTPAQREVEACSHWLDEELDQVRPDIIIALGSTALKAVTRDAHETLRAVMGRHFRHQGRWIVATYHPSLVLRAPGEEARHTARGDGGGGAHRVGLAYFGAAGAFWLNERISATMKSSSSLKAFTPMRSSRPCARASSRSSNMPSTPSVGMP